MIISAKCAEGFAVVNVNLLSGDLTSQDTNQQEMLARLVSRNSSPKILWKLQSE
jgi:hypothetical protein